MSQLVADYILERLREWGVHRIYGYPGDGINALLGALDRADGDPELIQVRHEEMAAFMACGHAKFTGEVGVCLATSGPGRDPPPERPLRREARPPAGRRDRRPAGAHGARRRLPAGGRPRLRSSRTSRTSTCRWRCDPAQIRHLIDRAVRIALAERTVTCVIVPNDLAAMEAVEQPPHEHGTIHSSVGYAPPRDRAAGERAPRAPRDPQRRREGRDPRRPGRARRQRRGDRGRRHARRRCREGAARPGRRCPTTCRSSPARSACSARSRAGS